MSSESNLEGRAMSEEAEADRAFETGTRGMNRGSMFDTLGRWSADQLS